MRTVIISFFLLANFFSFSTTFTVVNTNNSGSGSLREAVDYANALTGTHIIAFNIPTSDPGYDAEKGIWNINLLSTVNYIIRSNLTIDGTTQTTNQGNTNPNGPEISLDGNNNFVDYAFSIINASGITIKGLCIKEFTIGIQIFGPSSINNHICGNFVGITADGSELAGNDIGIEIIGGPSENLVGGTSVLERNVVSGNEHIGIRIVDAANNSVKGNYVGLNSAGTSAMPNYDGISIEGAAASNLVGGTETGAGNVVSGNYAYGVPVFGAGCDNNTIFGNLIGTDYTGTIAIPNTYAVLFDDGANGNILGGNNIGERNILSGNSGYGVFIYNMGTRNNIVRGNYIGTDITGMYAIPNANGIVIDGAAYNSVIENNVISGNLQQGIIIHITGCDSNYMAYNFIGTKADGTTSLGNGVDGIRIAEGPRNNIMENNTIAFNNGNGITIMHENDIQNKISKNSIFLNQGLGIDLFPAGVTPNDDGDVDIGPNQSMNFPVIEQIQVLVPNTQHRISGYLDTENPENCSVELFFSGVDNSGYGEGSVFIKTVYPGVDGQWVDTLTGINDSDFISATAFDEFGNTSEFSQCYNSFGPAFSEDLTIENNIKIYPNPCKDYFIFETEVVNFSISPLKLFVSDMYGRHVQTIAINQISTKILSGTLADGVYFYELRDEDVIWGRGRFVKVW